jgi:hypothetical protein
VAENKTLHRIRQLLARASHEGTPPEEREACLAKAQELKDKHAIEEWQLGQIDPGRATRPIVRQVLITPRLQSGRWAAKTRLLWSSIAYHCNVSYRYEYTEEGTVAASVGFESDIVFAEMLFAMASLEFYARIDPGWSPTRTFDDNVKRLKDSGKKWVEIALLANKNGGNPRTGREGSTTDGAWLQSAYRRECKRLGVEPTRHTQRHDAFRTTFAESFVNEIDRRLSAMRSGSDAARGEEAGKTVALVDRREDVRKKFWEVFPEMHPDEVRKRNEAHADAERARREAMTPKEREREDAANQKWWERHEAERQHRFDQNGWEAGVEAARSVDLSGGANGVPTPQRQAVSG